MPRPDFNDLLAFRAVARESSFTRAAAQLNVSPSALSHTIRRLEATLEVRLLARTTRSVALTDAGERLLSEVGHHFDDIDRALDTLMATRDKPMGTLRLNAGEHAVRSLLWPKLDRFLRDYPAIKVEVDIDNGYTDIVAGRYDAGVRLGEEVAGDMIAVRIGPDWRMAVVATPDYLRDHGVPKSPHDLMDHSCINLRLMTHGGFYVWEFESDGQKLNVRVEGQLLLQQQRADPYGSAGRTRPGLRPGRHGLRTYRRRPPATDAHPMVSHILGLPSLLPLAPAVVSGLPAPCRCAARE